MSEQLHIALCWYQPDEWEKLKQTVADPEILDATYDDWVRNANRAIEDIQSQGGCKVQKIAVKIQDLVKWCADNGLENNSVARSRYAVEKLQRWNR